MSKSNHLQRGGTPHWNPALALIVPALLLVLAACGDSGSGPNGPESDTGENSALATLTAEAAAHLPTIDVSDLQPDSSDMTQPGPTEPMTGDDAAEAARATQAAANATAGIAEVAPLVTREPPLATFTPNPGSEPDGDLLYVRSGSFWRIGADGEDQTEVASDDVPSVWAPPDDPGRAWQSPNEDWVAFFAGQDAAMWLMQPDGGNAHRVSGPTLPTDEHTFAVDGLGDMTVRLRPGFDYTLVLTPNEDDPASVLVDDNSRHLRAEARIRIVHASSAYRDVDFTVLLNGNPLRGTVPFGDSTGDYSVPAGSLNIQLQNSSGEQVASLNNVSVEGGQLKTIFLFGDDTLRGVEAQYESSETPAGEARVRIFNTANRPVAATLDGSRQLTQNLAPGTLGSYVGVPGTVSNDQFSDLRYTIYGLRPGETPVSWSPDGERLSFIGGADGTEDVYVTDIDGPAQALTSSPEREISPAWSPNGRHLAWVTLESSFGTYGIQVATDVPSTPRQVDLESVLGAADPTARGNLAVPLPVGWVDDQRLFFYPDLGDSLGVWTYDIESDELTRLTDLPAIDPVWSPEAERWAFWVKDEATVYTLDPDGNLETVATGGGYPKWSPDGELLSWVEGDSLSPDGWAIHVVEPDGSNDRQLTEKVALVQESPPVPGPDAKRFWLNDGRLLGFTRAGRDYGAAEQTGGLGGAAGEDIENLWVVPVDGSSAPRRATDFLKVYYVNDVHASPDGDAVGVVGFSYRDRSQQMWALRTDGGHPVHLDAGVRWYMWVD